jgi:hypothetical protein
MGVKLTVVSRLTTSIECRDISILTRTEKYLSETRRFISKNTRTHGVYPLNIGKICPTEVAQ